jgi:hypothetical protein
VRRLVEIVFLSTALTAFAGGAARADEPPVWLVAPTVSEPPRPHPSYFEEHSARVTRNIHMFQSSYSLDTMRERDTLSLYGPTPGTNLSTGLGTGLFTALVVSTAHTPEWLRFAYDRALHLGPAIFEGGGMGAGFGGRM